MLPLSGMVADGFSKAPLLSSNSFHGRSVHPSLPRERVSDFDQQRSRASNPVVTQSRTSFSEALRNKHVNPVVAKRPVNEKGRVGVLFGTAAQFDRLVMNDGNSVCGSLRFEQGFELWRGLDHCKLCQRYPLVDERIQTIGKLGRSMINHRMAPRSRQRAGSVEKYGAIPSCPP
jgi:hypothetical protein